MYLLVWQFEIHPDKRAEFLAAYGSDGAWAQLFRRAPGYLGTELLSAAEDPTRYLTVDRWETPEHYERFQQEFGDAYRALDARLEALTTRETKIGSFTSEDCG